MRKITSILLTAVSLATIFLQSASATETAVPTYGYVSNGTRTTAQMQQALEDMVSVLRELPGGSTEAAATTLSSDSFNPSVRCIVYPLQPESGTSDNLSTINITGARDGAIIIVRNYNATNTITIKHGAGNVYLSDGADCVLNSVNDYVAFMYRSGGSGWFEIWRCTGTIIKGLPGGKAEASATEDSSSMLTPTQAVHSVDTYGSASSQNLDGIASTFGGNLLILRAANASHVVTIRNNQTTGAGFYKVLTLDGGSIVLDQLTKYVVLSKDTSGLAWREVSRAGGALPIARGGTGNAALGVNALGVYAGDGAKVTQITGSAGQSFRVNAGGTAVEPYTPSSGGGALTIVPESSGFTASGAAGTFYRIDTTGGAVAVTLPASPADGRLLYFYRTTGVLAYTLTPNGAETINNCGFTGLTSLIVGNGNVLTLCARTGGWDVI